MGLRSSDMVVLRCHIFLPFRNRVSCCRGLGRKFSVKTSQNPFLRISDEIQEAVHSNKPVVALETTIYTHGRGPVL